MRLYPPPNPLPKGGGTLVPSPFCGLKINSGNKLVMLRSSEASRSSV